MRKTVRGSECGSQYKGTYAKVSSRGRMRKAVRGTNAKDCSRHDTGRLFEGTNLRGRMRKSVRGDECESQDQGTNTTVSKRGRMRKTVRGDERVRQFKVTNAENGSLPSRNLRTTAGERPNVSGEELPRYVYACSSSSLDVTNAA